ncbi:MAG: site-specific integrase [Ruminococcaceae bacterium]|nr:site-specific integrase [Oscillospiraceae bacterium]
MSHSTTKKKKSASGMGNIRKKTKTVKGKEYTWWEARYTEGYDPGTGEQIQRSISGKTQKEVAQKLKEKLSDLDKGTYVAPCKMTVGAWLESWLTGYLVNLKAMTKQTYMIEVKTHLQPSLGAVKLENLDTHTIQKFYNHLYEDIGLSPKTIKNIHGILHAALEQAVANHYIRHNPTNGCKLPKIKKAEINALEPDEMERFLQEALEDPYCNLFIVALFTGMRESELIGLSWDNVDFSTGTITVRQQLQCLNGEYFMSTPKNGKERTICVAPVVMDILKQEQQKQQKAKQQARNLWNNPFNLVFTDALGKNLVRRTVVKHFKAVTKRAGLDEKVRFHDLRHTYAVAALCAGDDIKTVQENLGHATAAFTLDVYGHITKKMQQDSANRMQKVYENLANKKHQKTSP